MQLTQKHSDEVLVAVGPSLMDRVATALSGVADATEPTVEAAIRTAGLHPEVDASALSPTWRLVDEHAETVGVVALLSAGGAR